MEVQRVKIGAVCWRNDINFTIDDTVIELIKKFLGRCSATKWSPILHPP